MMNKVILIGRLGGAPDLRYTNSGKPVCNFSVATNRRTSTGDDAPPDWHKIVTWDRTAETCARYLGKGKLVAVEGRMQTSSYEDREGKTRYKTEVVAHGVRFLSPRDDGGPATQAHRPQPWVPQTQSTSTAPPEAPPARGVVTGPMAGSPGCSETPKEPSTGAPSNPGPPDGYRRNIGPGNPPAGASSVSPLHGRTGDLRPVAELVTSTVPIDDRRDGAPPSGGPQIPSTGAPEAADDDIPF